MEVKSLNRGIVVACVAGVLISTYALYVELKADAQPGYKALCDLSERASCSRVLTSEYSKGFGILPKESAFEIPNCIYGIAFYCLMIILSTYDHPIIIRIQMILALCSCASSVYLAYLLAFVLKDLCIVCVSTYFVNGAISAFVYKKIQAVNRKTLANNITNDFKFENKHD